MSSADLGVIVAGGVGARLGLGVPKNRLVIGGRSMLGRAIDTLREVASPVVVATPRDRRPLDDELYGAEWVEDAADAPSGPLAGIVAAFAGRSFERALVLGVDLPRVRAEFLRGLLAELDRTRALAVAPAPWGVLQPMVAAYSGEAATPIARAFARGERAPSRVLTALCARTLDERFLATLEGGLDNLIDVDTPADLEDARLRFALSRAAGAGDSGELGDLGEPGEA